MSNATATVSASWSPTALTTASASQTASRTASPTPSSNPTTIAGVNIIGNRAGVAGGGIFLSSCDALLGGVVVSGNTAPEGGGVFSTGASAVSVCATLFFNNLATQTALPVPTNASSLGAAMGSSALRGSATALASAFGGGWAVLDPLSDVHLCDAAACATYLEMDGGVTGASAMARLPFSVTLATLVAQAATAQRLYAGPTAARAAALTGPLAPGTAASRPSTASAAAVLGGLTAAAAQLAPNATNCAWAGNAASGPGGDISVRSSGTAAAVAAAFPPLVYLADSILYSSTSAVAGGAVYAATQPVSLSSLAIVGAVAGDVFACSSGGSDCALAARSSYDGVTSASGAPLGSAAGFGGAIALNAPVYAEITGVNVTGSSARYGGALWLSPYDAAFVAASADASIAALPPTVVASSSLPALASAVVIAAGTSVPLPPTFDGRIVMQSIAALNVSAAAAGGAVFVAGSGLPACFGCGPGLMTSGGSAAPAPAPVSAALLAAPPGYGPAAASLPVRLDVISTAPLTNGSVSLVSLVAAPVAVATLRLIDAFNQSATSDFTTVCTVTVLSAAGDGSALVLMYPAAYTAAAGVIGIFPFGITSAPGSAGTVQLTCTVGYAGTYYKLSRTVVPVVTSTITLKVAAVAAPAAPAPSGACGLATANLTVGAPVPHAVLLPSVAGEPITPD